jgi:dipeptidyl aminopeptidase/acylaminoacyl peptidase
MKSWKKNLVALATASIAASPGLLPAASLDLDRITPVPESEVIPIMDFFRPSLLQQPTVNPSGTHIAAVVTAGEDNTSLMVYDLKNQKMDLVGARGDSDIDSPRWLTDDRLMYRVSVQKLGGFILAGAKINALHSSYPILQNINGSLVAVPPKDRLHPLFAIGRGSEVTGQEGEVLTLNAGLESGLFMDVSGNGALLDRKIIDTAREDNVRHITFKHPVLKATDGFDLNYFADKDGHLSFGVTSTDGIFTLHHLAGDQWEPCPENLDEIRIISGGDNPRELVVLGARKDGKPRALEIMDGVTGKTLDTLLQDKAYDFDGWVYRDPVSQLIVGAVYNRVGPSVVWFSETYRNLQKLVDGLFPGKIVRVIGNDEAGKMVLLSVYSDRQPPIYNWVDLEKHSAGLIKNSAPWLDPKRMQPMNVIKFKTRDGHHLDAYVTMPSGASKQNPPPLVVLPHRSSAWRDTWGFNHEVQFLASRGYAVMQPNYRGSEGSSWMFPTDDEWAYRKMHEDVTDATKAMVASGLIDPKRVAIMGTSFGGFLALSGAAYEPDLYRCAVAISAVSDWSKLIADYRYNKYSNAYFSRMVYKLGDPSKDPEKWDAISPLHHADKIRAAVFIANGEYDAPTAIRCSKELASIVSRNNIPVETVSFQNEADGVRHLRNKIELYTRIEAFLAKNLAPKS